MTIVHQNLYLCTKTYGRDFTDEHVAGTCLSLWKLLFVQNLLSCLQITVPLICVVQW